MSNQNATDLIAIETLQSVRRELGAKIDSNLIENVYTALKEHIVVDDINGAKASVAALLEKHLNEK